MHYISCQVPLYCSKESHYNELASLYLTDSDTAIRQLVIMYFLDFHYDKAMKIHFYNYSFISGKLGITMILPFLLQPYSFSSFRMSLWLVLHTALLFQGSNLHL